MQAYNPTVNILLLEDNQDLADEIIYFLGKKGHRVEHCDRLISLLQHLERNTYDILLLDRLLPEGDTLSFLPLIKQKHVGMLIIISALGDVSERISGLQQGVDHYFAKPVNFDELLAYINNYARKRDVETDSRLLHPLNWTLKGSTLTTPLGEHVILTMREASLIDVLINASPAMVDRNKLLAELGEDPVNFDFRRLDSALYRIRKKVQDESTSSLPVKTYHRRGYSWQI
ncbi:response regulator transcription factor [Marinomonas sp. IMCC 4694]|uniref:response regulator transcription factor n=1 Tax=Marinomonas sp. IMCC 4694 TaxID=2605432 RepID=UPI0011E61404|nr:response regulator transcription factor [Marinomonas sp. IMCC 4694]TYL46941.1 response regulator transcription factor [Marinomonas sp. IMCC 4694]